MYLVCSEKRHWKSLKSECSSHFHTSGSVFFPRSGWLVDLQILSQLYWFAYGVASTTSSVEATDSTDWPRDFVFARDLAMMKNLWRTFTELYRYLFSIVFMYNSICLYTLVHIYNMYIFIHMYGVRSETYTFVHVCIFVCMYVCMFVCMYPCNRAGVVPMNMLPPYQAFKFPFSWSSSCWKEVSDLSFNDDFAFLCLGFFCWTPFKRPLSLRKVEDSMSKQVESEYHTWAIC